MSHVFHRHTRAVPPVVAGGEGVYITDRNGKQYLDASGGAAVSCLGHDHPDVLEAIRNQLDAIPFAHTGFFTSDPLEQLASHLSAQAPGELDKVYVVSGGALTSHAQNILDGLKELIHSSFQGPESDRWGETIANLDVLEAAVKHAQTPLIPRRKPHEHNNFLVVVLADIFDRSTDRKASVTTNPVTDNREGPFVDFVMSFAEHFLPDEVKALNPRAIQRALKMRKDNPEEDHGR